MLPLFLIGLLVGLLVYLAERKTVAGAVAECAACARNRRVVRIGFWVAWLGGWTVYLFAAYAKKDAAAGVAALALLTTAIANLLLLTLRTAGRVTSDLDWVYLTRVHPDFVHEIGARLSDAEATQGDESSVR